jgi:hypothetical protein
MLSSLSARLPLSFVLLLPWLKYPFLLSLSTKFLLWRKKKTQLSLLIPACIYFAFPIESYYPILTTTGSISGEESHY